MEFTKWLQAYDDDELEDEEKEFYKRKIRKGLSAKSPFTAFKRQIIKDTQYLYEEFGDFFS